MPLPLLTKSKKSLKFSDKDEAVGNEQMVALIAAEKTEPAARDAAGSIAAFYRYAARMTIMISLSFSLSYLSNRPTFGHPRPSSLSTGSS